MPNFNSVILLLGNVAMNRDVFKYLSASPFSDGSKLDN